MLGQTWRAMSGTAAGALLALVAVVATEPPIKGQPAILADGVVESTTGGFKFPDGSIQETAAGAGNPCPTLDPSDEMIEVGGVCVDKYEASVWSQPDGGIQYGVASDDYPCSNNGQDCDNIFARSVPGVTPSRFITWFQAQAALANAGKRFPTNAEWQMAVLGTPDPGDNPGSEDCNTSSSGPEVTGERENCVSRWGHHDMVGNLWEWVADWGDNADNAANCTSWASTFGGDLSCVGLGEGETNNHFPGALLRGGSWNEGAEAGPFAVHGLNRPSDTNTNYGFRGAR